MRCEDDGPKTATGCAACGPNVRNNYFRGKLMTVADYQAEQRYMIARRRVVNRLLLGWGVISGFEVGLGKGGLIVGAGEALDPCGREVIACDEVVIKEDGDLIWLKPGTCGLEPCGAPEMPAQPPPAPGGGYGGDAADGAGADNQSAGGEEGYQGDLHPPQGQSGPAGEDGRLCYLLCAHHAERNVDGVRVSAGCDDSACETNRICETVVYSLRPPDESGLPLLATGDCEDLAPAQGQVPAPYPTEPPDVAPADNRGQAGLCLHDPDDWCDRKFDPCCPPKLSRCGDLSVDFGAGLPLAYVCFTRDRCGELVFTDLHEIIRGCELTRIKDIGWPNWHGDPNIVIGRTPFFAMFVKPAAIPESGDYEEEEEEPAEQPAYPHVDTGFWVCFSAPVQIASLNRDVVSISLMQLGDREAVGNVVRVPIGGIWYKPTLAGDPQGTTRGFRPFVTRQFWQGEIQRGSRSGFKRETLVEIRIRGNAIIDWAGRPIDADSIAQLMPSGNGTPGGEFLSSWRVKPKGAQTPPRGPLSP